MKEPEYLTERHGYVLQAKHKRCGTCGNIDKVSQRPELICSVYFEEVDADGVCDLYE